MQTLNMLAQVFNPNLPETPILMGVKGSPIGRSNTFTRQIINDIDEWPPIKRAPIAGVYYLWRTHDAALAARLTTLLVVGGSSISCARCAAQASSAARFSGS